MDCCKKFSSDQNNDFKFCPKCGKEIKKTEKASSQELLNEYLNFPINLGLMDLWLTFVDKKDFDRVNRDKPFTNINGYGMDISKDILEKYGLDGHQHQIIFLSSEGFHQSVEYDMGDKNDPKINKYEKENEYLRMRKTRKGNKGYIDDTRLGHGSSGGEEESLIQGRTEDSSKIPIMRHMLLEELGETNFSIKSMGTIKQFLISALNQEIKNPVVVFRLTPSGYVQYLSDEEPHSKNKKAIMEKQRRVEEIIKTLKDKFGRLYYINGSFFTRDGLKKEFDGLRGTGAKILVDEMGHVEKIFDLEIMIPDEEGDALVSLLRLLSKCRNKMKTMVVFDKPEVAPEDMGCSNKDFRLNIFSSLLE